MNVMLVAAIVLFVCWLVLVWAVPVSAPAVHLLYAAAATLFVREWARTH